VTIYICVRKLQQTLLPKAHVPAKKLRISVMWGKNKRYTIHCAMTKEVLNKDSIFPFVCARLS
jgi:hypothetical protein